MTHSNEAGHLTTKELLRKMKSIDKDRAGYRAMFTSNRWGQKEHYHLCVNTSGKEIKAFIPALAAYVNCWFEAK